jgi:hypothetical protein
LNFFEKTLRLIDHVEMGVAVGGNQTEAFKDSERIFVLIESTNPKENRLSHQVEQVPIVGRRQGMKVSRAFRNFIHRYLMIQNLMLPPLNGLLSRSKHYPINMAKPECVQPPCIPRWKQTAVMLPEERDIGSQTLAKGSERKNLTVHVNNIGRLPRNFFVD